MFFFRNKIKSNNLNKKSRPACPPSWRERSRRGRFIVIDGTDGSGKATQTKLLAQKLERTGFDVKIADFPQYGQKSAGLIKEYLNGKYGEADTVNPYHASIFFACDRYDASFKIKKWLNEGSIVISDRYVTANMGHQGGKIKDSLERKVFFEWLYKLEYELFEIPKPDLNIILHVETNIAQKLVNHRGNKKDIHEKNEKHLVNAEKTYLEITKTFPNLTLIKCTENGEIMTRDKINDLILEEVLKLIINKDEQPKPQLKVKRLTNTAKIPQRARSKDAGIDIYADDNYTLFPGDIAKVKTGIKLQIPEGHAGLIWDKSGIARQRIHVIGGVIDSNYRGEIIILIKNLSEDIFNISRGQKIAQILIQKIETPKITENYINDETERGENEFGNNGLF